MILTTCETPDVLVVVVKFAKVALVLAALMLLRGEDASVFPEAASKQYPVLVVSPVGPRILTRFGLGNSTLVAV
jgi:hypothetical protein